MMVLLFLIWSPVYVHVPTINFFISGIAFSLESWKMLADGSRSCAHDVPENGRTNSAETSRKFLK
jgi:hypothetical protein